MKAALISAAAVGLATTVAASAHHHGHEQYHRREMQVETVTDYITDMMEEIIVYMDAEGKPVSSTTVWKSMTPHTEAPAAAPAPSTSSIVAAAPEPTTSSVAAATPEPTTSAAATTSSAVAANFLAAVQPSAAGQGPNPAGAVSSVVGAVSSAVSAAASAVASAASGSKGGIGFGSGVSYSPYHENRDCKTADEIAKDLANESYDVIRLYGTDCKQVENTLEALKGKNTQLFVGIFDVGSWDSESATIINAVKAHANGDWSRINTVSVGNEVVNDGGSVSQVTSAVSSTRDKLRSAGFDGPVVTVDTMVAHRSHPELCQASDFCAMNCHAFFDGNTLPEAAGPFVLGWVQQIASAHPSKKVIVTESGWPSQGSTNEKAVPSVENQKAAIDSLSSTFSSNMILFSLYNNLWQTSDAAQFNAEKYWGFKGNSPVM